MREREEMGYVIEEISTREREVNCVREYHMGDTGNVQGNYIQ